MGKRCIVALDTDHIKQYVFATDKLKEIRGASSRLDHLNRRVMADIASDPAFHARSVYTNGGSGLFLIEADRAAAEEFGRLVQQAYHDETKGGASITFAVEEIPDGMPDAWNNDIGDTLELARFGLARQKNIPHDVIIALPSHPFLRVCDACGSRYAEGQDPRELTDDQGRERFYCTVCLTKRGEDVAVKDGIDALIERRRGGKASYHKPLPYAWEQILKHLPPEEDEYPIPPGTARPNDFNDLRGSGGGKEYLALIYADGNSMGQMMSELRTLAQIYDLAKIIDEAVYQAMSVAIRKHLQVLDDPPMFPFDILLIGGDDIMIATAADVALDVACTLATTFFEQTRGKGPNGKDCSLSVGVVLAPVKYPFGPLHDLAESTLKFAKKIGAKRQQAQAHQQHRSAYGDTLINFITVTGSTSPDFDQVYAALHDTHVQVAGRERAFYATRRPYTVEALMDLLEKIRQGKQKRLGRTKLHQVREAVLHMNLSTSVYEGMAVLRNWRDSKQRDFVRQEVYPLGERRQATQRNGGNGGTFQRVTFPWYADGADAYRTALLDYVELYDFVPQEAGGEDDEP